MKTTYKTLLGLLAAGGILLTGCREDEELNLKDYPGSSVGFEIEGAEAGVSVIELNGTYDNLGTLQIDGKFGRQYVFALSTPNPEDVTLYLDLFSENIPADRISMDKSEVVIPSGRRTSEPVTVTLADEDFSFMEQNKEAMTYELGVKVTGYEGRNVSFVGDDFVRVVLNKEAYVAGCSFQSDGGKTISFRRDYANGEIVSDEPMEYTFKMHLERPADADVTVSFKTDGLPDRFKNDVTLTPATVTIPAGAVESEEITWALKDDFLLTTDESEQHELTLTASVSSTDPTVVMTEGGDMLTFSIQKVRNVLKLIDAPESSWTMYDRKGWSATGKGGYGSGANNVLDGNIRSDYYGTGDEFWIAVDMQEARDIAGVVIRYYGASYASLSASIEYSNDGEVWTELGTLNDMPQNQVHTFKILVPAKARYIRFNSLRKRGFYHDISEIEVYH